MTTAEERGGTVAMEDNSTDKQLQQDMSVANSGQPGALISM